MPLLSPAIPLGVESVPLIYLWHCPRRRICRPRQRKSLGQIAVWPLLVPSFCNSCPLLSTARDSTSLLSPSDATTANLTVGRTRYTHCDHLYLRPSDAWTTCTSRLKGNCIRFSTRTHHLITSILFSVYFSPRYCTVEAGGSWWDSRCGCDGGDGGGGGGSAMRIVGSHAPLLTSTLCTPDL